MNTKIIKMYIYSFIIVLNIVLKKKSNVRFMDFKIGHL